VRLEKAAILLISGSCVVAGCVWTVMYFLVFEMGLTTALPLSFVVIVSFSLLVSHIRRNIRYAIYTQIVCIIYIPSFVQWSIGGIFDSGLVLTWALCGPIVALIFLPIRQATIWFGLYSVNILITVIFDSYFSSHGLSIGETTQRIFILLNILISSSVIFAFAGYFVSKAITAERTLTGAVEAMGEGFAYFDKNDRLKIFNEKFASFVKLGSELKIGTRYEDIAQQRKKSGVANDADFEDENFVEEGMRLHRDSETQYTTSIADGMWLIVNDSKTKDGGSVIALTDITKQKRVEKKLAEKESQLRVVLDNMPGGVRYVDKHKNYVFFNSQYSKLYNFPDDLLKVGESHRVENVYQAERGDFGSGDSGAFEGVDDLPAFSEPQSWERTTILGRTLRVNTAPTPLGGIVNIVTDITERKKAEDELEEKKAQLEGIIENITEGLVCYDNEQRLILCNSTYREFYAYSEEDVVPGTLFEDLVQLDVQRGTVDEDYTYEQNWITYRNRTKEKGTRDIELKDGRWLQVRERSTASGTVSIQTDITERKRAEKALAAAHKRSNDLLLNAIPEIIAERLKEDPDQLIADRHEDVSIMFTDVAGFTALSANQDPAETVNMLNALFSEFDDVCGATGIEKIHTIGDGYMVVGGAPLPLEDHTVKMIEAANKFLCIAHRHNIDIRIGVNCGEVVAGVVGTRRFHYDVWGDAVNVAARMETTGEVGKIHVSSDFAERLKDRFPLRKRDPIKIKGKGTMQTWFIEAGTV
jgi:PAS domain S-box-containing protein